jgi:hypothetical protein
MSEIKKYKKYLNFKANPRYLTRDFIVPLYTGTEPDILDDSNTQRESSVYKEFPNDMPIVSPKEIQNQPYEQLQLADGGRANFSEGSKLTGTDKTLEQNIKSDHKAFNDYRKSIGSPTIPLDNEYIRMWIRTRLNKGGSVERQGYSFAGLVKETKDKLTNESNPQKKFQLKKRLNFLEDIQKKSKNIQGAKSIENLVSKKDKLGRPFFSDYLEKINALEDLQNNKYLNPKTNKTFTPQEWLEASPSYRGKFRDPETFLEKKKEYQKEYMRQRKESDPEYKQKFLEKKKEEYYSKERADRNVTKEVAPGKGVLREQRNKLLSYMSEAAKDNPNYKDIIKEGKFIGVFDKENKINYYEAGYKGKLGKNSKLITEHPDFKNVNNLSKLADTFKRNLPNKAITSYFSSYERVPTMSEMYSFLQADPKFIDKMSPAYFKKNPLELHHQISMTDSPSQKIQLLLRDRNNQSGLKMMEYQKGNITKEKLNKELKKLNTRYYVDGKPLGAIETSPENQLRTAKSQTTKLFNKKLQENPELVKQMTEKFDIKSTELLNKLGCGEKYADGGRIKFGKGTNCFIKGLEKIQSGELNTAERNIAANFLKDAGADAKTIGFIKNAKNLGSFLFDFTIGKTPGAALVNFGINVPFAIAEAQEGKPGRQVLGTATDVIGLGPLVGTTEKDELTKAMGADADLYLKINNAMDEYNDIDRQRQLIENSRSGFQSPEEIPSDMREQELQLASKKLDQKEKELYNFLSPYLNKQKEVIYPKNIEKGLQILEDQERLRKSKSNLEMKNIPSVGEDILSTDNISFEKSNKNIDKKIEQLESEKLLYGSEIDKNMTPELMDVIYESGARGGAAEGGRIGLSGGGGPKIGRRGFLGLIAGAAAAPDLIKAIKGTGQAGKIASKIKLEKAEGMYPWFPDLVEKIKTKGKPFEEKEIIMEASYKHEPKGYGGLPKGEETVTRHVDGDTEFLLREYPDGRIAVDIHSPRNQEGSSTPVTLYYRPTMELKYYDGVKVEPAEFKVLEKEPRYFANGPDDVDIEMSEMRKVPGQHTIFGDVEAAERFATGKIENRKIIPAKQARREQMEDAPTDFIEETSPYGPDTF